MAKNYVQTGDNITVPAPTNVTSGSGVLIGALFGVAQFSSLSGEDVVIATRGVHTLPKTSALAIAIGDKVYWDAANGVVNKTATGNTLIGAAVSAAANPSATVDVRLNGTVQ